MEIIRDKGECPFCQDNLARYHKKPLIREGIHWILTENQWPYNNTRVHLLAIHRQHTEKLADLTSEAWSDLGNLVTWAEQHYQIAGGGLGMRFGDPTHNRGTVRHLHLQLLVAKNIDRNSADYSPIVLYFG